MATHAPALWKEASTGEIVRVRKQTFPSVPIPPHKPSGTSWQRCCSSCLAPGWFLLSVGFCIAPWQLSGSPSLIKVMEMSPAEFHKITEAENGSGWKEAQWVIWSHLPSKQGHPRAQCTVLQPESSGIFLSCWAHTPALALDEIYRQPH